MDTTNTLDLQGKMSTASAWEDSPPKGIRTPVLGLKSRCPRPLDDGGHQRPADRMSLDPERQLATGCAPARSAASTAARRHDLQSAHCKLQTPNSTFHTPHSASALHTPRS